MTTATVQSAKFSKKLYTSGYWAAARQLPAATFGLKSVCEAQYLRGYEAGKAAYAAGRAQRTMVWSTHRSPIAHRSAPVAVIVAAPEASEIAA